MKDFDEKQFNAPNRYDEFLYGFVHKEVTYCFFLIPSSPLPKKLIAYENVVRGPKIFAAAIQRHVMKYDNIEQQGLMLDTECMCNATGSFMISKICEQLYHIFILL